jgi:hypothetical protein
MRFALAPPAPNSAKNQTQPEHAIPGTSPVVVMARRMSSGTCRAPGQHGVLQSAFGMTSAAASCGELLERPNLRQQ